MDSWLRITQLYTAALKGKLVRAFPGPPPYNEMYGDWIFPVRVIGTRGPMGTQTVRPYIANTTDHWNICNFYPGQVIPVHFMPAMELPDYAGNLEYCDAGWYFSDCAIEAALHS